MGCVTMTYNAPLKKYLMCVPTAGHTAGITNTYILESDQITGPWKLVTYMKNFGEQAYFVNIPSKFISPDGRTAWLCYSANFTDLGFGNTWVEIPPGSSYAWCLYEIQFLCVSQLSPADVGEVSRPGGRGKRKGARHTPFSR